MSSLLLSNSNATALLADIQSIKNGTTKDIRNYVTQGGIFFVLTVDSIVFLIGIVLFLVCWKRTALYQKTESDRLISDVENAIDSDHEDDDENEDEGAEELIVNNERIKLPEEEDSQQYHHDDGYTVKSETDDDDDSLNHYSVNNSKIILLNDEDEGDGNSEHATQKRIAKRRGANRSSSNGGFMSRAIAIRERFVQWMFKVREYEIFANKYGHEVAIYLYFSKQMFLALLLCTFLGLSVLLPIHLTGTVPETKLEGQEYGNWKFSKNDYFLLRTTVSMVNSEPNKLYAHLVLTIVFVFVILAFLRRFTSSFIRNFIHAPSSSSSSKSMLLKGAAKKVLISNYSVQLYNLPTSLVDNKIVKQAVEEVYPNSVYSARIVLDMTKRIELQAKLDNANQMIDHYTAKKRNRNNRDATVLLCLGAPATEGCCGTGVNAISYWEAKRDHYQQKIAQWENSFKAKPRSTGHAHVIFKTRAASAVCQKEADEGNSLFRTKHVDFRVRRAPEPDDLKWKNFGAGFKQRSVRMIGVYIVLIFFLFFFTSPLSIVSTIQSFASQVPYFAKTTQKIQQLTGYVGDLLFQYLPTLLLFIFSLVIPIFIPMLTKAELYRLHSTESRVKMLRLFIYLLLSTLILPSLLLTSLDGVLNYLQKDNISNALQNLFLPGSGAFFLNYAVQYFLLGDFIDLLRLRDFALYWIRRWNAETQKEKQEALQVGDFDLAVEYAYLISFFGIILCYSVFSPFMLLVGVLYFLSKYTIDRHNITRLCNKNDKAQYKLTRDLIAYTQKTKLIAQLVMINVIVFEVMMLLFFAKGGKDLYFHLITMIIFMAATVVYCINWTIGFDSAVLEREMARRTADLVRDDSVDEDSILLSQYCEAQPDVYFSPYSLGLFEALQTQCRDEVLRAGSSFESDDLIINAVIVSNDENNVADSVYHQSVVLKDSNNQQQQLDKLEETVMSSELSAAEDVHSSVESDLDQQLMYHNSA